MWPFSKQSSIARVRAKLKADSLSDLQACGMPPVQAAEWNTMFDDIFERIYTDALTEGTLETPKHVGKMLLQRESSDPDLQAVLMQKRADGVTDADILAWWSFHDLECRFKLAIDDVFKMFALRVKVKNGLTKEEAATEVFKQGIRYGEPNAAANIADEDRPLPVELRERVMAYSS
jgi:hypothetical protein